MFSGAHENIELRYDWVHYNLFENPAVKNIGQRYLNKKDPEDGGSSPKNLAERIGMRNVEVDLLNGGELNTVLHKENYQIDYYKQMQTAQLGKKDS